jgi:hypothetical protein
MLVPPHAATDQALRTFSLCSRRVVVTVMRRMSWRSILRRAANRGMGLTQTLARMVRQHVGLGSAKLLLLRKKAAAAKFT